MKNSIMNVPQFVYVNNLEAGDVIVVKKNNFKILDHYVVFLGWNPHISSYVFIANMTAGVTILTTTDLSQFVLNFTPIRIKKFIGTREDRILAIKRAFEKFQLNEAYNLFTKNCEHLANFIQTGIEYSQQSQLGYMAMGGAGLTLALKSKNKALQFAGIGLTIYGLLNSFSEASKKDDAQKLLN